MYFSFIKYVYRFIKHIHNLLNFGWFPPTFNVIPNFINVFCLHLETNHGSQGNQFMWNAANLIFKRNHCTLSLNRTVWILCAHKHGISLESNDGLPHICVHRLVLHGHRVPSKYHLEYIMISYRYLNTKPRRCFIT